MTNVAGRERRRENPFDLGAEDLPLMALSLSEITAPRAPRPTPMAARNAEHSGVQIRERLSTPLALPIRRRMLSALDFCRKETVAKYPFEKPHRFPDPAEFWQPLVHPADGVFGRHSRRDAALENLVRNSNRLLGSRFCRSRWCWLGYHNRIWNRLRNIDGLRAGLMSSNHARPH